MQIVTHALISWCDFRPLEVYSLAKCGPRYSGCMNRRGLQLVRALVPIGAWPIG
jgi:hypothetical protein